MFYIIEKNYNVNVIIIIIIIIICFEVIINNNIDVIMFYHFKRSKIT